ncbi:MAG TPA: ABC transporter substrate-binding protein, partial [Chloroflexota bacterium]
MQLRSRAILLWAGTLLVLTACASPIPQAKSDGAPRPAPAVKKRATLAASSSLVSVGSTFVAALPGAADVNSLLDAGLTNSSPTVVRAPQLAEVIPSTENGLWKVLSDGKMETTWKLQPNASWHDGTAFTADDLLFTFDVYTDKQLAARAVPLHNSVQSLEAVDPHTLLIRWKTINISADQMFSTTDLPLPRHLLEGPYQASKEAFQGIPFWTRDYVGTGPFRLKEFAEGSHVVMEAYPDYFLGRPLIDEIVVRFIPDSRTLVANVLAGEIDITLGRGLSSDQAAQLMNTWKGRVELDAGAPNHVSPQHGAIREPEIIGNADFRRALFQAIDRQEMANVLTGGLGAIAHSGLPYGDPTYREAEAGVVKYAFDP